MHIFPKTIYSPLMRKIVSQKIRVIMSTCGLNDGQ